MGKFLARFRPSPTEPVAADDQQKDYEDDTKLASVDEEDVKSPSLAAEKVDAAYIPPPDADVSELDPRYLLANGEERPIETAEDMTTRCISLEDDPELQVHTLRMWKIGLGLTCFAGVLSQIFFFRPQTLFVSQLFLQVIAYILGISWAKILPKGDKGKFWAILNPCDFNIKEHVAILVMASTATHSASAIAVFAAKELYYDISANVGVAIFALLGSQLFGYGVAGLLRSFTVFPTYILFPNLLPTVNLFDVLHRHQDAASQKKRLRFFWICFVGIFFWEWLPEFIAPTLIGISIFCLTNRDSPWFTRIFGGSNGNEGLGMFSICLHWAYVGSGGGSLGALFTPFSTQVSFYVGIGLCCLLSCTFFAGDVWHGKSLPFMSQQLFYENGTEYDQLAILNPDYSLNKTLLATQGLPWYASSNAIYYLGCNLAIGATITHLGCWYLPTIRKAFKEYRDRSQPDPHYQKMLAYREVPMWAYGATLVVSFAMAVATCYAGNSQLPWWALILALALAAAIFPPIIVVYAITGFVTDTQHLAQMFGSSPGLTRDLKLSQYTKLPPISTFVCQLVGTVTSALLQLVIMESIISAQREILLSTQGSNVWSGQQVQSTNTQAVAWGALGREMYASDRPYFIIPMSIIIGFFIPLPFWIGHKFFPKFKLDQVVTPIICWAIGDLSVGINSSIMTTMCIAIFSQYYLRKYRATWFRKYNYLVSAGLDGGTQFMIFIATFTVQGGAGDQVHMPIWALNLDPERYNYDWCMVL